jgi:hypothetical protein
MWCFCDCQGVHPASVSRLKMEVYPADAFTLTEIASMVQELISAKLLREFEAGGEKFWHVTGWHHQKIEKPYIRFPAPPKVAERKANRRRPVGNHTPTSSLPVAPGLEIEIDQDLKTPLPPKGESPKPAGISKSDLSDVGAIQRWLSRRGKNLGPCHDHRGG